MQANDNVTSSIIQTGAGVPASQLSLQLLNIINHRMIGNCQVYYLSISIQTMVDLLIFFFGYLPKPCLVYSTGLCTIVYTFHNLKHQTRYVDPDLFTDPDPQIKNIWIQSVISQILDFPFNFHLFIT